MPVRVTAACSLLAFLLLMTGTPAAACRFEAHGFEQNFQNAKEVLIASVATDEMGLVTFRVDNPVKGDLKAGDTFTLEETGNSCGIDFTPGQVWLYMGPALMDGSFLLSDEYGRIGADAAALAREKIGYDVLQNKTLVGGTLANSCAPWDGGAFDLNLDNGVSVSVYKALEPVSSGVAGFDIDPEKSLHQGGGFISVKDETAPPDERAAPSLSGKLEFGSVTDEAASGKLTINEGEHKRVFVFRVKRDRATVPCG